MQVPERLALIGGSILLASTLVFTLKSQASNIIPQVGSSISSVYDRIHDVQPHNFDEDYQQAQKSGQQTGQWGSSKYYIDTDHNMYVGAGALQGSLYNAVGSDTAHALKTLTIRERVQAPQDSSYLFSAVRDRYSDDNHSLATINGTENVDTSQAQNMTSIFANDRNLNHLDLSTWNTGQLQSLYTSFNNTDSLNDLKGLNNWNTSNVGTTSWAFYRSPVTNLDLSNWHMRLYDASNMFNSSAAQTVDMSNVDNSHTNNIGMLHATSSLQQIRLGDDSHLNTSELRDGTWKNGDATLSANDLMDGTTHPGTWNHN